MTARFSALHHRARTNAPITIAFALFIALAIPASIINVAWEYIYAEFEQPYDALGVLLLFFTGGRLVSTFAAGRVVARVGLWRSIMGGMTLCLFGLLLALLSPSWLALLMGMLVLAYGAGTMDIGLNLYIASRSRPGIVNFLHASYGVGLTLGPQIVAVVVIALGLNWRLSYLPPLVVLVMLWLWTFASRAQWTLPERENDRSGASGAPIRVTLVLPIMWVWLLFALLYGGFEVGTGQLSNDLLTKSRGLDAGTASAWISLYYAAFTAGRFLSGFVAGRLSETATITGCCALALAGAGLVFLPGLSLTLPGMLLIGLSLAGIFPTLISNIPRRFGPDHAPNAIGFTIGVASLGTAVLPGLGALLAARTDFAVIAPFLVGLGIALLMVYALIVRQSRPRVI